MHSTVRRFGALALGLVLAAGCSQDRSTTAPAMTAPAASSPDLLGTIGSVVGTVTTTLKLTTATGLQRKAPLARTSPSRVHRRDGGVLSIPGG